MGKNITLKEWELIEDALMRAEVPYKVSFDTHKVMDGTVYDKIVVIEPFIITRFEESIT